MEKKELSIDDNNKNMKAQKFGEYLLSLSPYERSVSGSRVKVILAFIVSIHAPAWGATLEKMKNVNIVGVSIHAPAWGATPKEPNEDGQG